MPTLILYTTGACHLCEQAADILAPLLCGRGLTLEEVEISDSEDLMRRYGTRIPVVELAGVPRDLGWPFDAQRVIDYLSEWL